MDLNKKLDELFILLDNQEDIKEIEKLKKEIGEEELTIIQNFRNNPTILNKQKLYENKVICDYLKHENQINYLIMQINAKFKRSKKCPK